MEEKNIKQNTVAKGVHKVYLNARKSAVMSGVKDVLSFDAKEVTAGQRARTERANELKFLELSGEAENLEEFSPF